MFFYISLLYLSMLKKYLRSRKIGASTRVSTILEFVEIGVKRRLQILSRHGVLILLKICLHVSLAFGAKSLGRQIKK